MSPLGPGKYDEACTAARKVTGGEVILIVINGELGNGFSAQMTPANHLAIVAILRLCADDIEASFAAGKI